MSRLRGLLSRAGPPLAVLGLALAIWYAVSYLVLSPRRRFLLPPAHEVITVGFLDPANRAELLTALAVSARVALVGLAVAAGLGLTMAVVMSQARWLERSLFPYAVVLQTVPILAMVPLFGHWLGFGFTARVLVCVLVALFPIVANTLFGLRSVDPGQQDLFTLHGAGRLVRLRKLLLPAALPSIVTGLRISAGLSVIGAIVGDFFFRRGERGIGILIDVYRVQFQPERMFAAVILSSLLGLAVFWSFGWLGRRVTSWHASVQPRAGVAGRPRPARRSTGAATGPPHTINHSIKETHERLTTDPSSRHQDARTGRRRGAGPGRLHHRVRGTG